MLKKRSHRSICTNIWKELLSYFLFHYYIFKYTGRTHIISLKSWNKMGIMSRLYLKMLNQYPSTFHIVECILSSEHALVNVELIQQTIVMVFVCDVELLFCLNAEHKFDQKYCFNFSVCTSLYSGFLTRNLHSIFSIFSTHWLLLFHSASTILVRFRLVENVFRQSRIDSEECVSLVNACGLIFVCLLSKVIHIAGATS